MSETSRKNVGFALFVGALGLTALTVGLVSCTGVPTAKPINGTGGDGNTPPTLTITEPNAEINVARGVPFLIRWTDTDPDNNASISFDLVNLEGGALVPIVAGLAENDQTGPDSFTVPTSIVPEAAYNLRGTIDDAVNPPVETFATIGTSTERLVIRIQPPGTLPGSEPPRITITQPQFDQSVTQNDVVTVVVAPTPPPFGTGIFDRDSEFQLWVVLDTDLNPGNDDPANPVPGEIIVLANQTVAANTTTLEPFNLTIDLASVPPLPNGEPYFIRATADDALNPRVHSYAAGTLSVVRQVAGVVDLSQVGRTLSGARFYGFNPAGNLGSKMAAVSDFDADGVDDMTFVSRFGNPRNAGQVGEAYLIYGLNGSRFGGTVAINSVSEAVEGVVFEAPPVRFPGFIGDDAASLGITDVTFLPDMNGDLRPELIFGLPFVVHAIDTTDFDPSDDDIDVTSDTNQIERELSQGRECFTFDNEDPVQLFYAGVVDTYISTDAPNTALGDDGQLAWQNAEGGPRKWTLIKFQDILDVIPEEDLAFINIDSVEADIELRLFDPGAGGNIHQLLTDFDEDTTYSDFAVNGGDPEAGVDYVIEPGGGDGELDTVNADDVDFITLEVNAVLQRLIDGLLTGSNNELRFIIVPDATDPVAGADEARTRSSEFGSLPDCPFLVDRPVLRIQYTRRTFGPLGCYPDFIVNNRGEGDQADPFDIQWYAGGMAVIVNSTNRDNEGAALNPTRLSSTAVSLELTGQEPGWVLDTTGSDPTGSIRVRAHNEDTETLGNDPAEANRLAGVRITQGGYEAGEVGPGSWTFPGPPLEGLFGQSVSWMGDVNNDTLQEIVISAPRNERFLFDIANDPNAVTTISSALFTGSIIVLPGTNYNQTQWRDTGTEDGVSQLPFLDHGHAHPPAPGCQNPEPRHMDIPADTFMVFAEDLDDMLGGAGSAGDFNQDGLDDLLAGAYLNDRSASLPETGAAYVLYTRTVLDDFDLKNADDPLLRSPMIRIRGVKPGDQIGWRQTSGRDVNGDRIDDVFIASPRTDFGGVTRDTCGGDFDGDGDFNQDDLRFSSFELCQQQFGNDLFLLDDCKVFDYDNDNDIDDDDRCVFCCLSNDCSPAASCVHGKTAGQCCLNVEDNGFVGVLFGGRFLDGDRNLSQLATSDLPGAIFYGGGAGDRAGMDVASAGDFNQDGFGDIIIAAPGETRVDSAGRTRVGVVYVIFGGTHLTNTTWNLSDPVRGVGSEDLPGIVFFSPYVAGRPNEAAPLSVAGIGDVNNDGFDDIAIGNPRADFIDLTFPQGPDAPGSDAAAGRRRDAGDVYIVYGNNFGSNRGAP